jgi:hypothetical protein
MASNFTECIDPECDRTPVAQHRCDKHYRAARKAGAIVVVRSLERTLEDRYWDFVSREGLLIRHDLGRCWSWTGWKQKGYGKLNAGNGTKRTLLAHIVSWDIHFPDQPRGDLCVLHKCDNPECGRPEHLRLGTKADNNYDKVAKGRNVSPRGELSGHARFTEQQVREIRSTYSGARGELTALARRFGVTPTAIKSIVNRKNWGHLA